jgi:hypothetical protein
MARVFIQENKSVTAEVNSFIDVCRAIRMIIAMTICFSKAMLQNGYVSEGVEMGQTTGRKDIGNVEYCAERAHSRIDMAHCVNE